MEKGFIIQDLNDTTYYSHTTKGGGHQWVDSPSFAYIFETREEAEEQASELYNGVLTILTVYVKP